MDKISIVNGKELRKGYTTGSTGCAAATAAVNMLLTGERINHIKITLPSGDEAIFEVVDIQMGREQTKCAVIKDGGDDPDVTHGLKIFARVTIGTPDADLLKSAEYAVCKNTDEIKFESTEDDYNDVIVNIIGGTGVGKVKARGLQCDIGEPAINPIPRKMIRENVRKTAMKLGFKGQLTVEISVPKGEETALKTFNPRLGIKDGISILGTTGIVEPMSEKALIDTIKVSIDKRFAENSEIILISPGNYGIDYCKNELGLDIEKAVEISNYLGEALDYIKYKGFKKILFVGHTGKLVKVAAGVMNTHSSYADCRMETIACHSGCLGAESDIMKEIMNAVNTDEAFDIIKDKTYYEDVKRKIMEKAMEHLNFRLKNEVDIQILMYTTHREHIIKSEKTDEYIEKVREED